jgi:DNA polymerase III subunit chi
VAEVWFYHLESKTADQELPGLLQRGLDRKLRMAVITVDAERVKALSLKLWGQDELSFLPHGFAGEPFGQQQLIYLCADDLPANNATFRFYLDGTGPQSLQNIERASLLFNGGDDAAVQKARDLWRQAKTENVVVRYWKQDEEGRWRDQAAS